MAVAAEKRDLMELVGVAVGSRDLSSVERRERHVDLVAAVGAASARLHYGDQGVPIAVAAARPRGTPADRTAAELAPMLWHLKAGGQEQTAQRVAAMFATWLCSKREFADVPGHTREAYALRVVEEWVRTRCLRCRGAGLLELDRRLGKIAPRSFSRNARLTLCDVCAGSRRALPNHQRRAEALGIERGEYDDARWYRRFRLGLVWMEQIARRLTRPLQSESGRSRIAP